MRNISHPEGIYRCNAQDYIWKLRSSDSSRTKRQVNALYVMIPSLPSPRLSKSSPWKTRKSLNSAWAEWYLRAKVMKILKSYIVFAYFFITTGKHFTCEGTLTIKNHTKTRKKAENKLLHCYTQFAFRSFPYNFSDKKMDETSITSPSPRGNRRDSSSWCPPHYN